MTPQEIYPISYGFRIERTAKIIKQVMQRRFNALHFDLTVDQWVLLDCLRQQDGQSQNELAEKTFKDAPTVTRIIDLLCKKELTERRSDPTDRRRFKIYLTQAGQAKIKEILPVVIELRKKGIAQLSRQDYDNLIHILDAVFENFS